GCGVQLADVAAQSPAHAAAVPVMDINQFLAGQDWSGIHFAPLQRKVAVHEACTLRNVLRASNHLYPLLARVPGLEIQVLAGNDQCCGAAGTYYLDQPEFANALLDDKLQAIEQANPDYLVTANVGCALHMANGLLKKGKKIE